MHTRSRLRPLRPRAGGSCAGRTLAELVIVLTVVGVLAAVVTPRINRAGYDADAAARVVQGALQTAQRAAVAQQIDVVVGFDLAGHRLRVLEDVNANGVRDLGARPERVTFRPLDPTARFATPPAGVTGGGTPTSPLLRADSTFDGGLRGVRFHRDGSASENVEGYVAVVRRGVTEWRAVVVTRATGRVAVWRRTATAASPGAWTRTGP